MDEITFNTPSVIKLGSFAGKVCMRGKKEDFEIFILFYLDKILFDWYIFYSFIENFSIKSKKNFSQKKKDFLIRLYHWFIDKIY